MYVNFRNVCDYNLQFIKPFLILQEYLKPFLCQSFVHSLIYSGEEKRHDVQCQEQQLFWMWDYNPGCAEVSQSACFL